MNDCERSAKRQQRAVWSRASRRKPVGMQRGLACAIVLGWIVGVVGIRAQSHRVPSTAIKPHSATASSVQAPFAAERAIDGVITEESSWRSRPGVGESWIELDLGRMETIAGVHVYNGFDPATALKSLVVQFWRDGLWHDIPSSRVADNQATALGIAFDDTLVVQASRLRILVLDTYDGQARIKEVAVWPANPGGMPSITPRGTERTADSAVPRIYLNQSGFNVGKPKRFTAPTLPENTPFVVRLATGGPAMFSGVFRGQIGDFTAFNPVSQAEFVVAAGAEVSVPFRIGHWWMERITYQSAVDFMIDSRHYVGNWRPVCRGSFAWRDDHHFAWELHTLVPQFLSNPSAYARMPQQVNYERPADPSLWGALEPYREDAPDLVKLIHWGADVILTQGLKHEHLKAQLAYFLYAWPWLKQFLPVQNYIAVLEYTFAHWSLATCDREYPYDESPEHDLLALKTKIGTTKGAYPPGFSVQPNLLLYEVARREGRADAERYFEAARRQVQWMIAQLDWSDPQTTKGQRMSEFLTATGLAHFLLEYPDRAPPGLQEKLEAWATVAIRRSDNLWDFRKLSDGDAWVPTGPQRTMWNEPGNVLGLPGALLAVQPLIRQEATRGRLEQLAYAHLDNAFGRNPTGRHFSYDAARKIEGVEHGWYSFHHGGIGQLGDVRFAFDGSPKNQHYPYHPEQGNIGWTEAWVNFNTAFNQSLAWMAFAETKTSVQRVGNELVVTLTAPLNFDYSVLETGQVMVTAGGDEESVVVTEDSPNARTFTGRLKLQVGGKAIANDGLLQVMPGTVVGAQYGFGYLARRATLKLDR